ncbi:MAG: alpha/beta hydrolase family protein [Woeseiaceae bacterium]
MSGRAHLIIQSLGGDGPPAVIPPPDNADFSWLRWANGDRVVFTVTSSDRRGLTETTETRLWAANEDGTDVEHIVVPTETQKTGSSLGRELAPAQLQGNVIHWLPDEPNHIMVSLDGDHNAADEVRRIDIRNGRYDIVRDDAPGIQEWMPDVDGELRFGWGYRRSTLRILTKNDSGMWRSVDKAAWWDAGFFPQGFSDKPDVAYMRGPDENGYKVIRTMNIVTNEFGETVFSVDSYDVGGMIRDPLTGQPIGVSYTTDKPQTFYFDTAFANLQKSIDKVMPHTVNRVVSLTADRRKMLIRSSSDVDAGTYSYLNRDTGNLSLVAEAMPGLAPELMSEVTPVSYEARDGLQIPAFLTLPRGVEGKNLKIIVLPHGGPGARDDASFWYLSQFLASRGYAIFQPNFRGSTGYGERFERAGRKEWGGKMQEDVTDGANWLVEQGIADPDRMCIVGWSYGGYSAAMGAIQTPDLYQCAASINGVMDLPRLIADDRAYVGGTVWTRHIGLEGEGLKEVSPYHRAEEIQVPMLIIQAKDDPRVYEHNGKRMARRLERLDKEVTYVSIEYGGHSLYNEDARMTILTSLEKFLQDNLGDQ